jgi:NTE family protein
MAKKKVAVILAGAVAKGAYEAGALRVIARRGLEVTRLVAASSGALNGALYASYVRRGIEREGVEELVDMWRRRASLGGVVAFELGSAVRWRGVSSMAKIRELLQSRLVPEPLVEPRPISLRIVVAPLAGIGSEQLDTIARRDDRDPLPMSRNRTTHEYVCDFTEADFDSRAGRARIASAALASSAFPFAFQAMPVEDPELGELGPCVDGGAANNTPIKWALGGAVGDALDGVVVISPTAEVRTSAPGPLGGFALLEYMAMMLINERLYRDLREAEQVNAQLERLAALRRLGLLSQDQLARVLEALGWGSMKTIRIMAIRPRAELGGNPFLGFVLPKLRAAYLRQGEEDAEAAFASAENRWVAEA